MNTQNLDFSIIIPTYNRSERLQQCLESLTRLTYPSDRFEVIVVDDGSQVSMKSVVVNFESQISLRLIRQSNGGPASARNMGASVAQGNYLVFTDDDCQPNPDWLDALAAATAAAPNTLIGGQTINALSDNLYSTASQLLIDYIYDYYNQTKGDASFFASNNFGMPKGLYQQLGGFDTSFPLAAGEDREFCDRWQHHGYSMHYAAEMQIKHFHQLTFVSFWRQHFNYGRGAFCFHKVRSQRDSEPMQIEPFTFYFRLLTYPFICKYTLSPILLSGLFFLSQLANVAGFFWERHQQQLTLSVAD